MPIYMMARDMPFDELTHWLAYFERRPVGWRDDDRINKLIDVVQGMFSKVTTKPWERFQTLYAIYHDHKTQVKNPLDTLKGSALFKKLIKAKGGKKLDVD